MNTEIGWRHCPRAEEVDAYERVLGDAMAGDATLFAREDYVEDAWRIVDPVLKYEPHAWGPTKAESVTPLGGWENPMLIARSRCQMPGLSALYKRNCTTPLGAY